MWNKAELDNRWRKEAELKRLKGKVDIKDTALGESESKSWKRKQHPEDVTVTSSEESELGSLLVNLRNRGQDGADFIADMTEKAKAILETSKNAVDKNAVDTVNVLQAAAPPKTVEVSAHSDDLTVSIIPPWEANP